ncbi:MAG TPA: uracil-DNA glycosylase family protein [Chryseolinea sp.]|nr:uracil-DNA glycosylase family protein [Chryseolinea sp.]
MTFADHVLLFYKDLEIKAPLPKGVVALNPYHDNESFSYCATFYKRFFDDGDERTLILGINPGRHGGGVTGIPFTDPIKLEQYCCIPNSFNKKPELSADFIYKMIERYGGPKKFYGKFYFGAISPLGFTMDGKNLNYYDVKELQVALKDFIIESLKKQMTFGINTSICYCLGEGENFKFLRRLNDEIKIFQQIVPLAHPRFIMQYRRKKVDEYVDSYLKSLALS